MWLGPFHIEARAAYQRARNATLSPTRALVIGTVASYKDCWTFRRTIAAKVGCSIRTVQRALTQARAEGLIRMHRAKKGEIPPRRQDDTQHGPIPCGWSHRFVMGWGQAGRAVADAVHAAKARWLVKQAAPLRTAPPAAAPFHAPSGTIKPPARTEYQRRSWTPAELDAELDKLERLKKPPPS
jgi:hypothetical protein